DLRHIFGRYIVPQTIPYDQEVSRALLMGKSVLAASPNSPAAVEYHTLAQWMGLAVVPEAEHVDIFSDAASTVEESPIASPKSAPLAEEPLVEKSTGGLVGAVDIFSSDNTAESTARKTDVADEAADVPSPPPISLSPPTPAAPTQSAEEATTVGEKS